MECGHVGILTVDLHLPEGSSLKTKRKELLRVRDALERSASPAPSPRSTTTTSGSAPASRWRW